MRQATREIIMSTSQRRRGLLLGAVRHRSAPALVAAMATAALALAACASNANANGQSGSGSLGVTTAPAPPVAVPSASGTSGATSGATGTPTGGGNATTAPPASAHIVKFDVKQQPMCPIAPSSDSPFSSPGRDIVVEWNVTGATGIALSVDDTEFFSMHRSGSYGNYGPTGEVEIGFGCGTSDGPTTTHKYTLNTIGGRGPSVEKTLTVTVQTSP
jgi:hypothetical protein